MAWELKGQLIESCSCNMFCPCWFGVQDLMIMDQGWCAGVIGLSVEEGSSDGLDLAGRKVLLTVNFPGPTLYDGDGTARVFVDSDADDDQQRELEAIAQGKKGGPMENLAPLMSTWLPTQRANVRIEGEGDTITVSAEGTGEMRSELLRDPEGNAFTLRGGGFVGGFGLQEADLAPTSADWADADMPRRFETKSGARGDFTWSG
jgi:hypothetical protein